MINLKNEVLRPSISNCRVGKTAPSQRYISTVKNTVAINTSTLKFA
ncbi:MULTISPECIES: hypothetical protein [unclassified Flavobacterium]|jgi:hypothetical protein|nr:MULTISPECIES: hypothetical protein [unclassified Flavobacterium]